MNEKVEIILKKPVKIETPAEIIAKTNRVFESCQNIDQFETAQQFARLADRRLEQMNYEGYTTTERIIGGFVK
jgi:hypothetical protein